MDPFDLRRSYLWGLNWRIFVLVAFSTLRLTSASTLVSAVTTWRSDQKKTESCIALRTPPWMPQSCPLWGQEIVGNQTATHLKKLELKAKEAHEQKLQIHSWNKLGWHCSFALALHVRISAIFCSFNARGLEFPSFVNHSRGQILLQKHGSVAQSEYAVLVGFRIP